MLQIDGRPDETASPLGDSRTGSNPCRDGDIIIYIFFEVEKSFHLKKYSINKLGTREKATTAEPAATPPRVALKGRSAAPNVPRHADSALNEMV